MAYASVELTGTYQLVDGTPAVGIVEIIPSERLIVDDAGDVVLSGRIKVQLDSTGSFSVDLPATDDPALTPTGFGYTLAARLYHTHLPAVSFSLPAAVPVVDVTDVTTVDPSTFEPDANYVSAVEMSALDTRVDAAEGEIAGLSTTIGTALTSRAGMEMRFTNPAALVADAGQATTWVTPDASGVVVHPSVRFFPNGFNGYHWWAAITPYLNSDNQVENPCVLVSTDGIDWTPPPGVTNPLAPAPAGGYNSDTHLVQALDGSLLIFYRDYSSTADGDEKIRVMQSADGITWSAPVTVLDYEPGVKRLMSPAVWWDGGEGQWVMLAVEILADPRVIERRVSDSPYGPWTLTGAVTLDYAFPAGHSPWHIDAFPLGQQIVMLIQDATNDGGAGPIYLATSEDSGQTFTVVPTPIVSGDHYRSCALPRLTDAGLGLDLWIGGPHPTWGVVKHVAEFPAWEPDPAADAMVAMIAAKTKTDPYVLGDDFNRTNGAIGTASSGQVWATSTGTINVATNKAKSAAAGNARATIAAGIADHYAQADLSAPGAGTDQAWIVTRFVDASNYVRVGLIGLTLKVQRVTAGGVTDLYSQAVIAGTYSVAVECSGTTIKAILAGATVATLTEAQGSTSTTVGLQFNNTNATADNLTVRSL